MKKKRVTSNPDPIKTGDEKKDNLIKVFMDGKIVTVSERWFREIYSVPSGKD